ncbi:MAG: DEAD/DEAH box helicase [Proteobacteria bacterium]|nr:DEAD/DEAH box helicase [Pseudomonadota bacterium]
MKPEFNSQNLLSITKSKAKMFEYSIPEKSHIDLSRDPKRLFALCVSILGDVSARINITEDSNIKESENLVFAAQFFESFVKTRLDATNSNYLLLLSSAAYYLAGLPGNSIVVANQCEFNDLDILYEQEFILLLKLILLNRNSDIEFSNKNIMKSFEVFKKYLSEGRGVDNVIESITKLRENAYKNGTYRELLLADIIYAIVAMKISHSVWNNIPMASNLSSEIWYPILTKTNFIKEMWPSQLALAKANIFKGNSAVIQMPTSAGKTKSVEIIIRSAILSERSTVSVIITPFRALCHEIKMEMESAFQGENTRISEISDVLKNDLIDLNITSSADKHVLIFTPEKFLYLLKQNADLSKRIGLIIFDEGHLFDSGKRGVTYELLLTDLKKYLPENCQKILISAVISNASAINEWLNKAEGVVVEGDKLVPTYKNVGFVSWKDKNTQIKFYSESNTEKEEYFVPRIIETEILDKKPKERKQRIFPEKEDKISVAVYLGLKLVKNGGVAIFSGQKSTAIKLAEKLTELYSRNYKYDPPSSISDKEELIKLHYQSTKNLGENHSISKAILLGVVSHHGLVPHGMKLSAEYAIRNKMVHFVICTSTLAQGVNLPIRYIIFTSIYQGGERLKVRDFHNLIGRTGRAGIYTEGSILFSDPDIYDLKNNKAGKWQWEQIRIMLNKHNSEPCTSSLLSIFDPLTNDKGTLSFNYDPLSILTDLYMAEKSNINDFIEKVAAIEGFSKNKISFQIQNKTSILKSIENFLFMYVGKNEDNVSDIAKGTLAYELGNAKEKEDLIAIFNIISNNMMKKIPDPNQRTLYSKTMLGMNDVIALDEFIGKNLNILLDCDNEKDLFKYIWPFLLSNISNNTFNKLDSNEVKYQIAEAWLSGKSYFLIYEEFKDSNLIQSSRNKKLTIDNIIEICDNAFSFEATILVSAFFDLISKVHIEHDVLDLLELLQSKLKYGLINKESIIYFEAGFRDRVLAQDLANISEPFERYDQMRFFMTENANIFSKKLSSYPSFFAEVFKKIVMN